MSRRTSFLYSAIVFLLLSLGACNKKDSYQIHGDLRCANASTVYLLRIDEYNDMHIMDSTEIHGGEFRFRGKVEYPTMYYIQVGKRRPIEVLVENSDIDIKGSLLLPDEIKITGSRSFDELHYLQREAEKIQGKKNATMIELVKARKQNDKKLARALESQYKSYPDSLLLTTKQFISDNPTSVGAAYFVCTLVQEYDINKLEDIINDFAPSIANSEYVRYLNEELILAQKLSIGSPAPDFAVPASTGDTVRLADYEGKYLLIEFWASWCKTSQQRNTELKKIYERYREAGLEILSISLDKEESEWRAALNRDSMPWRQASDLLYWESPVSKYYRVQTIPYGLLIDPAGGVSSINPRKYTLEAKLKNIFGY